MQERHLGLCSRQAEVPAVPGEPPGSVRLHEIPEPFGDLGFGQPRGPAFVRMQRVDPFRVHELGRARALLPHVGQEREGIPGRDVEPPRPVVQDGVVVRKEAFHERPDDVVPVLSTGEGHREGKGVVVRAVLPRPLVAEDETVVSATLDRTDHVAAHEHQQFRHVSSPRLRRVRRPGAVRPSGSPFRVSGVRPATLGCAAGRSVGPASRRCGRSSDSTNTP